MAKKKVFIILYNSELMQNHCILIFLLLLLFLLPAVFDFLDLRLLPPSADLIEDFICESLVFLLRLLPPEISSRLKTYSTFYCSIYKVYFYFLINNINYVSWSINFHIIYYDICY